MLRAIPSLQASNWGGAPSVVDKQKRVNKFSVVLAKMVGKGFGMAFGSL